MRPLVHCISLLLLVTLVGCRAPDIPDAPSAREYAVWHDVLEFEAVSTRARSVVVEPATLALDESQLQFQRCLPAHMRDIFDDVPAATLSINVPEDWLRLPGAAQATLADAVSTSAAGETVRLRMSRVAFSRFHRDGYVWVEHQRCRTASTETSCAERVGQLVRVVRDGDHWTPQPTDCQTIAWGDHG